jgi:hypothetical protein
MKANPLLSRWIGAAIGSLLLSQALWAGLPQPMFVFYGQARDGYGLPYLTNAEVVLLRGTTEVARHTIRGSLTPGVNFALYAHLDDGRATTAYSSRAVRTGDTVSIVVRQGNAARTIMESRIVPPVGQPGEIVLVNVTASDDADGDGLPDIWEQELIAWSEGLLQNLFDVRPGDDFDGDGMSNGDEYRAGTFSFLPYDYLYVEAYERTPNQRLRLTFLSVPGKVYHVACTTNPAEAVWQPSPFALSDTDAFQETPMEGTGDWVSLYVPIDARTWFFRLNAH